MMKHHQPAGNLISQWFALHQQTDRTSICNSETMDMFEQRQYLSKYVHLGNPSSGALDDEESIGAFVTVYVFCSTIIVVWEKLTFAKLHHHCVIVVSLFTLLLPIDICWVILPNMFLLHHHLWSGSFDLNHYTHCFDHFNQYNHRTKTATGQTTVKLGCLQNCQSE